MRGDVHYEITKKKHRHKRESKIADNKKRLLKILVEKEKDGGCLN